RLLPQEARNSRIVGITGVQSIRSAACARAPLAQSYSRDDAKCREGRVSSLICSVIVPARDCAAMLRESLSALGASTLPRDRWELIVVDDGSTDETAATAAAFADRVLHLPDVPLGPAAASNRGAEVAQGEFLVFVDADVCLRPDVLAGFVDAFGTDERVAAVFGAYDTDPRAAGLVSQYRNLLHHYVHLTSYGDA